MTKSWAIWRPGVGAIYISARPRVASFTFTMSYHDGTTLATTGESVAQLQSRNRIAWSESRVISVLIVDDEPDFADTLRDALQHAGFAAAACYDGFAALQRLTADPCDILVTDFMMPGLRGSTLIDSARRLPHVTTRAVLMSSFSNADIQEMYAGHDAYIQKPFPIDALVGVIARLQAGSVTN